MSLNRLVGLIILYAGNRWEYEVMFFVYDVTPDGSICVSVAGPDTDSSVDKWD